MGLVHRRLEARVVAGKLDGQVTKMKRLLLALLLMGCGLLPGTARAHVGSPNIFFEGQAGPYPVRVVIRPAEVIPGLAEISVRVEAGQVESVTALPIKWNAGRLGAPPPDVAKPVRGETNLYSAQLWFMESGAQSVELAITGAAGTGTVVIPADAVATRVLPLPKALGAILAVLGLLLLTLLLSIVGAAVRESVLQPGLEPPQRRRWYARSAVTIAACLLVALLWGGKRWWASEASDYRNNRLYHPLVAQAHVRAENGRRLLRLEITDPAFSRTTPLVPDHGKLMHLFLMREPKLDAFAHLHPIKLDRKTFETTLPELPAGDYRLYADFTYETGLADTLTTTVTIPEAAGGATSVAESSDPDDSWRVAPELGARRTRECRLTEQCVMTCTTPGRIEANKPITLDFRVTQADGRPATLQTYLGMRGHLSLRRDDGTVFTHLHPGGSASMAAMQLAVYRIEGKLPLQAAFGADDPLCRLPTPAAREQGWIGGNQRSDGVSFPYAFPKPGLYRLWVQVKMDSQVRTGVFDVDVVSS
ncbi:MAG TPA: hypothetical protein VHI52_01345 [Verrucomicrobiae bacterium]|nr:hypothetical protein [Verrucomicrobiae bacterium]